MWGYLHPLYGKISKAVIHHLNMCLYKQQKEHPSLWLESYTLLQVAAPLAFVKHKISSYATWAWSTDHLAWSQLMYITKLLTIMPVFCTLPRLSNCWAKKFKDNRFQELWSMQVLSAHALYKDVRIQNQLHTLWFMPTYGVQAAKNQKTQNTRKLNRVITFPQESTGTV